MRRSIVSMMMLSVIFILSGTLALAQDGPPPMPELPGEIFATDLIFPYGLSFDADGNLWIAESGNGGDTFVAAPDPDSEEGGGGPITGGMSGSVTMVAPDGTKTTPFHVPSVSDGTVGGPLYRVYINDDMIWLVLGGSVDGTGPTNSPFEDAVVGIEQGTLRLAQWIDLRGYEIEHDTDGLGEILSNPTDLAWDSNGTMFINDTGANTVFTWTEDDGLQVFHTWTDDPVPTAIQIAENDDIYVGFLGQGIAPGAAHIEHWSADGDLLETFSGLSAVTDILVSDDGTLYAVELFGFDPANPEMPGFGRVVSVTADGATPVAEGLPFPHSIAQDADGALYVTINSVQFGPPMGPGMVLKLSN